MVYTIRKSVVKHSKKYTSVYSTRIGVDEYADH